MFFYSRKHNVYFYFEDFCIIFNHYNKMTLDLVSNLDIYFKGDRNICLHRELTRISSETGLSLQVKILDEALARFYTFYISLSET